MKKIIKNILWYLLNKLDPIIFKKVNISANGINIEFKKDFLRVDEFQHVNLNINYWIKVNKEYDLYSMDEVEIYNNNIKH